MKKAVKNVFDHIFDHLHDHNLISYRGIAQLVARDIWDVEAGSSSLPTPTKNLILCYRVNAIVGTL